MTPTTHNVLVSYLRRHMGLSASGLADAVLHEAFLQVADQCGASGDEAALQAWLVQQPNIETLSHLARQTTCGETFFRRDASAFDDIEHVLLPALLAAARMENRPLRIWSAGCSSGEEVYSLAAAVRTQALAGDVQILGSDLNPEALAVARQGRYGEWSFRGVSEHWRQRHFAQVEQGLWQVGDRLRSDVDFSLVNLADDAFVALFQGDQAFDLIVCRNVLLWFDADQAKRAIQRFARCLRPGGWLLLGVTEIDHAEQVALSMVVCGQTHFLHKPESLPMLDQSLSMPAYRHHAKARICRPGLPTGMPINAQRDSVSMLRMTLDLANAGRVQAALALCRQVLIVTPLSADAYCLHGTLLSALDRDLEAATSFASALYIDPDHVEAWLGRARLAARCASQPDAARCLEIARRASEPQVPSGRERPSTLLQPSSSSRRHVG